MDNAINQILNYSFDEAADLYQSVVAANDAKAIAWLGRNDRFFLLTYILNRQDAARPWIFDRCREVERDPDGYLDLWSRFHYKSTLITFAGIIQEVLKNPNITVGIFSKTRPLAKKFLTQIRDEFETNTRLKMLYKDVLWASPKKEASKWSLDEGISVRRGIVSKEPTISAYGLIDGMPTGAHFDLCVYDDVVDMDAVTSPDMIEKVTERWAISLALANEGAPRRWHVGTRYHIFDTYAEIIKRGTVKPRIHLCQDEAGNPTLMSKENLEKVRRDMGPRVYACQMLQNPVAEGQAWFQSNWLCYYTHIDRKMLNVYLIVDPAHSKKDQADSTAIWVVGLGADKRYYLLDGVRDKLNLTERTNTVFRLVQKWNPICVGYERYGLQADIEHIKEAQDRLNYHFRIVELGGNVPKPDRIGKLVPLFEQGLFWLPKEIIYTDYQGVRRNMVQEFIELEYLAYPVAQHDDMLDCLARIVHKVLNAVFPLLEQSRMPRRNSGEKVVANGTGFDPLAY